MELILVFGVFVLAAGGLALGLAFGRGPVQGSCGGISCIKGASCEFCPNRAAHEAAETPGEETR